jgi:hypothetical protein
MRLFAPTITGSLDLTGSLMVTGSFNISGTTTQIGNNNLLGQTNLSGSINISGSVNASANIALGGTLRLDPALDPGNSNLTSSFLFTSASNTEQGYDLYYRQDGNLVKFKWLEGGISSGLLYGGKITSSGSMIYVSSGSGVILDPNATFTKEINPLFTYVTWANYSASATYLTSSQNTYIYVDSAGTIHQQTQFFDQTQYEQAIPLGRVTHPNYTSITGIGSNVQTTYDSDSQQSAFIRAFGPLKVSGFSVQAHPGSLSFGVGSGIAYTLGGFYSQDPNSPSHYEGAATPTASIARAYRSGSGVRLDNNGGAFYTTIDPDYWDDGTGVLNTMAAGDWQIQRVFFNPVSGRSTVYYGQNTYTTLLNALQYLATDSFTEGDFTANSLIFIGYLVLKGQTNNIDDTNNNRVINAGVFRNIAGGSSGGGAVAQTLNDLSDVTITTPSNGQALIYNGGTWENGTPRLATTASYLNTLNQDLTFNGNLTLNGTASIAYLNVQFESASIIYSSGSNQFGDAANDTQTLWGTVDVKTGPLLVTGSVRSTGGFTGSFSGSVAAPGATTQVVFNNGGVLSATSSFVYSGSNVGIGTSTPSTKLHIVQTSGIGVRESLIKLSVSDAGNDAFYIGNGTSGDNIFWPAFAGYGESTIRSGVQFVGLLPASADASDSSNRGILNFEALRTNNATDPLNGTFSAIQNRKIFTLCDFNGPFVTAYPSRNIAIGTEFNPSSRLQVRGSGTTSATTALRVENSSATAGLTILDDGTSAFNTNHLYISSSGFIGVRTINPVASDEIMTMRLDRDLGTVLSIVNATNSANARSSLRVGVPGAAINVASYPASASNALLASRGAIITDSTVANGIVLTTSIGPITLRPGNTSGADLLTATGSFIGIGLPNPTASLHISGASSAALLEIDSPAVNNILFVTGSGRVGIGTSNPINLFDVFVTASVGSSVPIASLRTTATSGYLSFHNWTSPVEIARIESSNDISNGGSLRFYTKNTAGTMAEKVRVHGAGDVSIGSTTTSARLQVRGSGATSTTATLRVENSSALPSLTITDDLNSQFYGNVGIRRAATASLDVAGTTRLSGSFNTAASGSILTVIGSGSAQPIFTVQGSQGELFSITDSLSGSLFSVNDISGLPILEVFSDNTTLIGNYQDPMLITTAKVVQTNSGSFTVYSLPTASYDTAFFEYSVRSGSNARAGTIMAMQLGSTVNFTETTITDFGTTSAISFTVIVTGSAMALTGSSTTGSWTIKTIVRGI